MKGTKHTGGMHKRVGSVPKPTATVKDDGGGTCHKGTASKGGASGAQTSASSRHTK